jgi:hypothetical protein
MSKKTIKQRIALVAVLALGTGILSSAPASATDYATGNLTLTTSAASVANNQLCTTAAATSAATSRTIANGGSQQFTLATADAGYIAITGNAKWRTPTAVGTVNSSGKVLSIDATGSAVMDVTGEGTITVATYANDASTTVIDTFYFNSVASCVSGASVAKSFVQLTTSATKVKTLANFAAGTAIGSATTNAAAAMDNSNDDTTAFANAASAYIHVNTNNAYGVAYTTSSTLAVSCTNNAKVGGNTGGYYAASAQTAAYYTVAVTQPTANTALSTVCTVQYNGVTLATKSLTIVGDVASMTAVLNTVGNAEGSSTAAYGTITYTYKDAAGNTLTATGNLPSLTASTVTTKTNAIVTTDGSTAGGTTVRDAIGISGGAAAQSGRVAFNCLDYGTSDISLYVVNNSVATITSPVVKVICGGPTFTYTASLDKASYNTGDVATLTITAKSYNGDAVASNTTLGAGSAISLGGMTAAQTIATTDALTSGTAGTWVYMFTVGQDSGSYAGAVKIALGSAYAAVSPLAGKAVTVQYKIGTGVAEVSNAEVLKSIVALIASINKQIQALQKLILKR